MKNLSYICINNGINSERMNKRIIWDSAAKAGLAIPDSQSDQYFLQTMMQQIGIPFSSEKELDDKSNS